MKTVIIGGTFSPVHLGHLFLAEEIRLLFPGSLICFVPSQRQSHKDASSEVGYAHRLAMLRLAVRDLPQVSVEDGSRWQGGIVDALSSVRFVLSLHPRQGRPALVLGDDLFESFSQWKDRDELLALADLLVARRVHLDPIPSPFPHQYLENKLLPLSSREIRERVRGGLAFRHLVPEPVFHYIVDQGLYQQEVF